MKKLFFMFSILSLLVLVSYPADSGEAEIDISLAQRKNIEKSFLNLHQENTGGIILAYNQLVDMGVQMTYSLEEVQKMVSELTIADIYSINSLSNSFCYQMLETCTNPTGYDQDCFLEISVEILNSSINQINNSIEIDPNQKGNRVKNIFIAFLVSNRLLGKINN